MTEEVNRREIAQRVDAGIMTVRHWSLERCRIDPRFPGAIGRRPSRPNGGPDKIWDWEVVEAWLLETRTQHTGPVRRWIDANEYRLAAESEARTRTANEAQEKTLRKIPRIPTSRFWRDLQHREFRAATGAGQERRSQTSAGPGSRAAESQATA